MIDMSHHGQHRRPYRAFAFIDLQRLFQRLLQRVFADQPGGVAHFLDDKRRRVLIKRLVDGGHDAHSHQRFDDFAGFDRHPLGKVADGDHRRNFDLALLGLLGAFELAAVLLHAPATSLGATHVRLEGQFPPATAITETTVRAVLVVILAIASTAPFRTLLLCLRLDGRLRDLLLNTQFRGRRFLLFQLLRTLVGLFLGFARGLLATLFFFRLTFCSVSAGFLLGRLACGLLTADAFHFGLRL